MKVKQLNLSFKYVATASAIVFCVIAMPSHAQSEEIDLELANSTLFDTDTRVWLVDSDGDTFPDDTEILAETDPFSATDYPGSDLDLENELEEDISISADGQKRLVLQGNIGTSQAGFPASFCRSGYVVRAGADRLCINPFAQPRRRYRDAVVDCRNRRGRVATYEDLTYLYMRSTFDALYNPNGAWIGNMTGDDRVFKGNKDISFNNDPDIINFEGEGNKAEFHRYWCVHDRT